MKYRKKPVVIEAEQFTGTGESRDAISKLSQHLTTATNKYIAYGKDYITIATLEGEMRADINDWIIKGVKGEFYPCKPDIFEATYEPV